MTGIPLVQVWGQGLNGDCLLRHQSSSFSRGWPFAGHSSGYFNHKAVARIPRMFGTKKQVFATD